MTEYAQILREPVSAPVRRLTDALDAMMDCIRTHDIRDPDIIAAVEELACQLCIHAGAGKIDDCPGCHYFLHHPIH